MASGRVGPHECAVAWISNVPSALSSKWEEYTFFKDYNDTIQRYFDSAKKNYPAPTQIDNDEAREYAGKGIKAYLKDLWTAMILVNTLLITAAMTPFSQAASQAVTARDRPSIGALMPAPNSSINPVRYDHQTFGVLWSVTLSLTCLALLVSMLLLGYMLSVPDEQMYEWAEEKGEQGYLRFPLLLTLVGTLMFVAAVGYSAAVYYGLWASVPVLSIFGLAIPAGLKMRADLKPHQPSGNSMDAPAQELADQPLASGLTPSVPGASSGESAQRQDLGSHGVHRDIEADQNPPEGPAGSSSAKVSASAKQTPGHMASLGAGVGANN